MSIDQPNRETLRLMQRSIEGLHDIAAPEDVTAFVVDAEVWRHLPGAREGLPEQLLLRESEGCLEISLYIDPHVLAHLTADSPWVRLHGGNLESFCVAIEGVSHFVLLTHRVETGNQVSPLELEIQAEVDKFASALRLLVQQGRPLEASAHALLGALFHNYALRDAVEQGEQDRYVVANRVARAFCRKLVERLRHRPDLQAMTAPVRQFFRTGLAHKLRAAHAATA